MATYIAKAPAFNLPAPLKAPSFGGKSLAENRADAATGLARHAETERIWNRSSSQFTLRHLVVTSMSWSPCHQYRQVAAELSRRKAALEEAEAGLAKKQARIAVLIKKARKGEPKKPEEAAVNLAKANELEMSIGQTIRYYEGAIKDVIALSEMADYLVKNHGPFSEEQIEAAEAVSHLHRALRQSLRDMRQSGVILAGNQEYLEQIGIDPSAVQVRCAKFLGRPIGADASSIALEEFVSELAENLAPLAVESCKRRGLPTEATPHAIYAPERNPQVTDGGKKLKRLDHKLN